MVQITVDLDVLAHNQVFWLHYFASISLVRPSLQKLTIPEARVLSRRLVDLQTVIVQVIGDDELAVAVLRLGSSEVSIEAEADLLVYPLEEVLLGRLGDQSEDIAEGVLFGADAIVRRDDDV